MSAQADIGRIVTTPAHALKIEVSDESDERARVVRVTVGNSSVIVPLGKWSLMLAHAPKFVRPG